MNYEEELRKVLEITRSHNKWRRKETLNLIPSENVMSPLAETVYMTDMMSRYAEGKPFKRYYQGTKYVDEIEVLACDLINRLSGTKFCDLRPISGTIANAAVFRVYANCGDKALIAPVQAGSHVSHTKFGTLGALGIEHVYMPYDPERMNVDVDKASRMIEEIRPKFVVLGGSLYLFPHPVKELSPHIRAVGGRMVYDAAHVYGLIVGKSWPNPLELGADIMTASTHKTFPGPQGGVILSNKEDAFKPVSRVVFPWFVSNHHLHRLPSTAVTALEMLEYGESYASQVVRNARALAESLASLGFKVVGENLGFTRSHQVAVNVRTQGGGAKVAKVLEEVNIIVNKNLLPEDSPDKVEDPSGIRMGVQEMTRFGMKEGEMQEIASLMKKAVIDGRDRREVKEEVLALRGGFQKVMYTFDGVDVSPYSSSALSLLI